MIVTPIDPQIDWLKTELARSPGLHASEIFGSLFKELEPDRYDLPGPPNHLLWALGTAWERYLEYMLQLNGITAERPEEFMSPEGIAYSPDLILFNGVTRLGEIKLTSMSVKDWPEDVTYGLPPKFDKYICQMMLYAHWLNLDEGWLAVLFLHKPWDPQFRVAQLTFSEREKQENYTMLMNHARQRGMI